MIPLVKQKLSFGGVFSNPTIENKTIKENPFYGFLNCKILAKIIFYAKNCKGKEHLKFYLPVSEMAISRA